MGGQAAQLAWAVVVRFPLLGVVDPIDFMIFDGVEDGEGQVGDLSGVQEGLYAVFSAW